MKRGLLILIMSLLAVAGNAQNSRQSVRDKLEKEIAILDKQLKENEKKSSSALNSLSLTRKKVSSRKKLVEESNKEIKTLDRQIKDKEAEIGVLQARMDTLSLYYDRLIKNAYKNRDSRVWFMYILSSEDIGQGLRRFGYFKNLASQMNSLAAKLKETRSNLESQKEELMGLRQQAGELKQSRQKELDKLKAAENESQKLVNLLQRNKTKYQKELAAKKKQVENLNREINKMITQKSGKSSKPVDVKLSGEFSANMGKLPWPVEGSVIESFGQHYHPVYKSVKLPFNNGVNIATANAAQVKAVFDGEVRQVIVMPGYNQCVLIQHGEYFTFYCKLGSVSVKAGDKVKTGQTIGKVDTIAGETELHFQLWKGRAPQDPELWLR